MNLLILNEITKWNKEISLKCQPQDQTHNNQMKILHGIKNQISPMVKL